MKDLEIIQLVEGTISCLENNQVKEALDLQTRLLRQLLDDFIENKTTKLED